VEERFAEGFPGGTMMMMIIFGEFFFARNMDIESTVQYSTVYDSYERFLKMKLKE
jgi:hypothetical protein